MSDNKIKFGLKNVHYAPITESGSLISYDTPVHIPGAVNLTLDADGEEVAFYADDREYYEENTNNGYTGSLEMALIPDSFRVDVLGDELDANNVLIENKEAKVKKFALLFEFDGDAKKVRHIMYNVLADRPSVTGSTKTKTKEPQTESMNIAARPAVDTGDVKAKCPQASDAYDTFFDSVYSKDAPANSITGPLEFDKSSPDDLEVVATSAPGTGNKIKAVLVDGLPVDGVYLTVAGLQVTIDEEFLTNLATGAHTLTLAFKFGAPATAVLTVSES